VPLDGSPRAESALPLAEAHARKHRADLVLVHAVPAPELTSPSPAAEEDLEIEQRLVARNTRVAQAYLGHLRDRLADAEMNVRTLLYGSGDVRVQLLRCITEEHASLVVLSAHGRTGRTEIPFGTIAGHLVEHGTVPLLIVREPVVGQKRATQSRQTSASVRLPPLATA
jgi:nucleotide-binding universal stress UspA family protein